MQKETEINNIKGFVKVIWQQLMPLNKNPKFKLKFKDQDFTFIINIIDGDYAAFIKVKKGEINVESIKNGDKAYMKNLYNKHNCHGMLETNLSTLIDLASGNLSTGAMLKKILKKQMRVKGLKNLRVLSDLFDYNLRSLGITGKTMLKDVIKNYAEFYGTKPFLTYVSDFDKGRDEIYTYKDIHLLSNRLGNGLIDLGIGRGDGIALMSINSPEYLFTILAAMKLGAYIVLVNTGLKGEGLKYIIDHSDASSIVVHWSFLDTILDIKDELPKVKNLIIDLRDAPENNKVPEGVQTIEKLMEAPERDIDIEVDLDDLCMLMYTAGTTGLPKAITFWQGKLLGGLNVKTLMKMAQMLALPDDVVFTPLPLFHSNALFLSSFASYLCGLSLVLGKRFSATRHWDICRKYEVTTYNTLGAMVTFLMKQPERPDDKDHKVRTVNTAACPKELWEAFENRFGVRVQEAYGATDGGGFMLLTQIFDDVPVGTMGKPMPGVIAEIQNDDGNILTQPEEIGELVFLVREKEAKAREVKYFKDSQASKNLIQVGADGQRWFHSGDLAFKNEEGWFFFVDRKKDSIRRRGENIAAYSIEKIIMQDERILECAAYGVKTDIGEDDIMVSLVLKPGKSLEPEEIIEFCRGKMADFMVPRYINIVDELPKNEVHRVLKRVLKDRGITESTFDSEKN